MWEDLKQRVSEITASEDSLDNKLASICALLQAEVVHYDWVGFYFHAEGKPELYLKAYAGEPTEHTVIPFGKGICGQVAVSNENFVVPDVHAQDNYIACSLHVKSEIVVPLFQNGKNIGQIDIDSHMADAFTSEDESFLEYVNALVSGIL